MAGILVKITDSSSYTVVFDDGDERTLKRTSLCIKGEKHFNESETLDHLPLTDPENFGTPVMQVCSINYSWFYITFPWIMETLFQTCCKVQKFIIIFTNWFVNNAYDWLLFVLGPIRGFVCKPALKFQYELSNFATKFRTKFSTFRKKLQYNCEINCKCYIIVQSFLNSCALSDIEIYIV